MENRLTALIIEDECMVVFLLKQVLKEKGIFSVQANTLKDAREVIQELQPTFIFVDNSLPDGLGFGFIPNLLQISPHSKIIAMTAQNTFHNKEAAFKQGADCFLEKPFTIEQVHKMLKREQQVRTYLNVKKEVI